MMVQQIVCEQTCYERVGGAVGAPRLGGGVGGVAVVCRVLVGKYGGVVCVGVVKNMWTEFYCMPVLYGIICFYCCSGSRSGICSHLTPARFSSSTPSVIR